MSNVGPAWPPEDLIHRKLGLENYQKAKKNILVDK